MENALHEAVDSKAVSPIVLRTLSRFHFPPRPVHSPADARSTMASVSDFPARGKIIAMQDRALVFAPLDTNYELRLEAEGSLEGAKLGMITDALIRLGARKIWTVPSGGNFVEP